MQVEVCKCKYASDEYACNDEYVCNEYCKHAMSRQVKKYGKLAREMS